MTEVENKEAQQNGEETISTKSRFCKRCNAMLRWQCECRNNMAWQRRNVFHGGKRYKGKDAWEKVHAEENEYKGDSK